MVDKQPENDDVSQPMGAWEGRSNKTIRNCRRQLSCVSKKFCRLQCLLRGALTTLVSRLPCACYTPTPHSTDLFQLGSASHSRHVIGPQNGFFLKIPRKIKKIFEQYCDIGLMKMKVSFSILSSSSLFFLPSFIPIIYWSKTYIAHFVLL